MNRFDTASISAVTSSGCEIRFIGKSRSSSADYLEEVLVPCGYADWH
jgi:hypothetical protein